MIYQGSCHCGAITFEIEASEHIEADGIDINVNSLDTEPRSVSIIEFDGKTQRFGLQEPEYC